MAPYFEQVIQAVEEIVYDLSQKSEFKETTFRFGFLVYRDDFADKLLKDPWCRSRYCEKLCVGGLCERKRLENTECNANKRPVEESGENFLWELDQVRTTRDDHDDYPKRLFDGLKAAIPEIASCEGFGI
jgi:hypothetical protein